MRTLGQGPPTAAAPRGSPLRRGRLLPGLILGAFIVASSWVNMQRTDVLWAAVDASSRTSRQVGAVPCSLREEPGDGPDEENITEAVRRFQVGPAANWTCHYEAHPAGAVHIEFIVRECPPSYSASTFHLQTLSAWTSASFRAMGAVGDRYGVRDGCGLYRARVAAAVDGATGRTEVDLFWTSSHRRYSSTVGDTVRSAEIKANETMQAHPLEWISKDRAAYLDLVDRHLDRVGGFPRSVRVVLEGSGAGVTSGQTASSIDGDRMGIQNGTAEDSPFQSLPDCASVPLAEWGPVGIASSTPSSPSLQDPHPPQEEWKFQSSRCNFADRTLPQLNQELAGLRVKYLGDSHGQFLSKHWRMLMCPDVDDNAYFHEFKYDCPNATNAFQFNWRFFRGVIEEAFASS